MGGLTGGKGGGDAPKPPNAQKLIELQKQANLEVARQTAALNRVNQITPFGSALYTKKGDTYTLTQSLDPLTLGAIQNNTRLAGGTADAAYQYLPTVQASLANPVSLSDFESDRQGVEDALAARLNPYLDRQQSQLNNQLANQGISLGSKQYADAQNLFGQQKNDAYTQLVLQANNEQAKQFALAQAEQQQPLNNFLALAGHPGITGPQYQSTPQTNIANTDVAGIYNSIYNAQLNAYNNAQNNAQAGKGSILGLAGALGGAYIGGPYGAAIGGSLGGALGNIGNGASIGSGGGYFGGNIGL